MKLSERFTLVAVLAFCARWRIYKLCGINAGLENKSTPANHSQASPTWEPSLRAISVDRGFWLRVLRSQPCLGPVGDDYVAAFSSEAAMGTIKRSGEFSATVVLPSLFPRELTCWYGWQIIIMSWICGSDSMTT